MNSQLDTSVYGGFKSNRGNGLGTVFDVINGVSAVTGMLDKRKKDRIALDEETYLNGVLGKHLAGWNGADQNDLFNRGQTAINEIVQTKPELYAKVAPMIDSLVKGRQAEEDRQFKRENDMLDRQVKTADLTSKQISNNKSFLEYQSSLHKLIADTFGDKGIIDDPTYKRAGLLFTRHTNITPAQLNFPENYEEFAANKDAYVAPHIAEVNRLKQEADQIKLESDRYDMQQKGTQARIARINEQWLPKEKQAGLDKTAADIDRAAAAAEKDRKGKDTSELAGIDPETGKPYTAGQRLAANFGLRLTKAEETLDRLSGAGFNPATVREIVLNYNKLNAVKDPALRQYAQAMRTFINGVLRRESGAAIAQGEFDSANAQYFAMLGDDPETLEQKKRTRLQVIGALRAEAGSAYGDAEKEYNALLNPSRLPAAPQGSRFKIVGVR